MGCSSRLAGAWSLPVVIDASSCTHGLLDDIRTHIDRERQERFNKIQLFDAIARDYYPDLELADVRACVGWARR